MTPFLAKVRRASVIVATVLGRVWESIKRLFPSKIEVARRAAERLEMLKRKEMEAERIDRLMNPHNYQGK